MHELNQILNLSLNQNPISKLDFESLSIRRSNSDSLESELLIQFGSPNPLSLDISQDPTSHKY